MKVIQHRSIILLNIKCPKLSKPKAKATVARNGMFLTVTVVRKVCHPICSKVQICLLKKSK